MEKKFILIFSALTIGFFYSCNILKSKRTIQMELEYLSFEDCGEFVYIRSIDQMDEYSCMRVLKSNCSEFLKNVEVNDIFRIDVFDSLRVRNKPYSWIIDCKIDMKGGEVMYFTHSCPVLKK